ncbi:MAG: hypothetical protein CMO01_07535 [Thalassobius sp.]|nr:hypothetical protein [Thalassovita sp.]
MRYLQRIYKLIKIDWRKNFPIVKKENKPEFIQEISFENIHRLKYISFFALFVLAIYTIVDIAIPEFHMYLVSDVMMLVFISTSTTLYLKHPAKTSADIDWKHIYHFKAFALFILGWSGYVASFEIEENGYIYSYLLCIFIVSVIFYTKKMDLFILFTFGFLVFIFANFWNYGYLIPKTKVMYVVLTHLFCWVLSRLQFAARTQNFIVTKQLSNTNVLLNKEITSRIQAETDLLALAHNLEERVEERTTELSEINFKLELEIEQHKTTTEELIKSEKKLNRQNAKLIQLNDELDMFVYRTSHDIRGPISSVLGLLLLLRNESNKDLFHFLLDKIEGSMNKLDGFINDINDFSDNSRLRVRKEQINFQEIIENVLKKIQPLELQSGVEVNIIVNNPKPFFSDEKRVTLILKSIIENAFVFQIKNHPKKEINIEVDTTLQNGNALITVTDNGCGIDETVLDKVFEMFYRGSSQSKGSGLGLYVAKVATQKIGGIINIKSQENKFTQVIVNIPCLHKANFEESHIKEEIDNQIPS